ncbi:putative neurolysin [Helianthus annuus]|nr:putative neurolysin [Helianthus annuus]
MCNRASYAKFSGLRLDSDFVEIPAQVLENWYVCVYYFCDATGVFYFIHQGHPKMYVIPNLGINS